MSDAAVSDAKDPARELGALDPRPDLRECGFARRGRVVGERREAAVIRRAELVDWDDPRGLEHTISNRFRSLDARSDRVSHANEYRAGTVRGVP